MTYFIGDWYSDSAIMRDFLDDIEFYSGTERRKMLIVPPSVGGSMLFGTTWRSYLSPTKNREFDDETGKYKTKVYAENPHLKGVFKEFSQLYFPDFSWEQIQLNKNFKCPPHKDKKNIGESVLCCFGDYTGGETFIEKEDGTVLVDAREKPVIFNGAKYFHGVNDYEGTRYSLVFFKNYIKKNSLLEL